MQAQNMCRSCMCAAIDVAASWCTDCQTSGNGQQFPPVVWLGFLHHWISLCSCCWVEKSIIHKQRQTVGCFIHRWKRTLCLLWTFWENFMLCCDSFEKFSESLFTRNVCRSMYVWKYCLYMCFYQDAESLNRCVKRTREFERGRRV